MDDCLFLNECATPVGSRTDPALTNLPRQLAEILDGWRVGWTAARIRRQIVSSSLLPQLVSVLEPVQPCIVQLAAGLISVLLAQEPPLDLPDVRVVLLVPAEISPQLNPTLFANAVQLYATESDIGSVVMSNLPKAELLSDTEARALGHALDGQMVVWPTSEGPGSLVFHVLDLESSSRLVESFSIDIPARMQREFYRQAALKLQSLVRSILRAHRATTVPPLPSIPRPTPLPTIERRTTAASDSRQDWGLLAGLEVFGSMSGVVPTPNAGLRIEAGVAFTGMSLGMSISQDLPRSKKIQEGTGRWSTTSANVWGRLRFLQPNRDARVGLQAELGAGAQCLVASGELKAGATNRGEAFCGPYVSAAAIGSYASPMARGELFLRLGVDGFPMQWRIFLREKRFYGTGWLSGHAGVGYRAFF